MRGIDPFGSEVVDIASNGPARAEDFSSLLELNAQSTPGVSLLSRAELNDIFQQASYFHVLKLDSLVLGYIIAYFCDSLYEGEEFICFRSLYTNFLYIDQVAVLAAYRARGIGTRLYRELEAWANKQGISLLACEVNLLPPNPISLRFHERQGYRAAGELATQDGRRVALMTKKLAAEKPQK